MLESQLELEALCGEFDIALGLCRGGGAQRAALLRTRHSKEAGE
jgi:hypothetical protein